MLCLKTSVLCAWMQPLCAYLIFTNYNSVRIISIVRFQFFFLMICMSAIVHKPCELSAILHILDFEYEYCILPTISKSIITMNICYGSLTFSLSLHYFPSDLCSSSSPCLLFFWIWSAPSTRCQYILHQVFIGSKLYKCYKCKTGLEFWGNCFFRMLIHK
jgi:hypothetical protein